MEMDAKKKHDLKDPVWFANSMASALSGPPAEGSIARVLAPSLMNYISNNVLSGLISPSDLFLISPGIFDLPAFWSYFSLIESMMLVYYLKFHKLQTPHTSSWYLQYSAGSFLHFGRTVTTQPSIKMFAYMPMLIS